MKTETAKNKKHATPRKHPEEVIEQHVRPLLREHGGDIAIREIRGKEIRVELLGNCGKCPAAQVTIEETVQRLLSEHLGEDFGQVILINDTSPELLEFAKQLLEREKKIQTINQPES